MADELDRRAQILEAALEEFSAKGFKGATIKSIARAAGLQSCARHPLPHRWLRTLAGARKGDALPQVNGGGGVSLEGDRQDATRRACGAACPIMVHERPRPLGVGFALLR